MANVGGYDETGAVRVALSGVSGAPASSSSPLTTQQVGAQSVYRLLASAASTNALVVKNAPAVLAGGSVYNSNAAPRFLKFYDKSTAPVVGTDTPVITELLPASSKVALSIPGLRFVNGIAIAITANAADNDTAPVALNDIQSLNLFIG